MFETLNLNLENYLLQAQAQISVSNFIFNLVLTAITAYILKEFIFYFGQALSNREVLQIHSYQLQ